MATRQHIPSPLYCIGHRRFTKQNGWRLHDLSVSLNGNIAVAGYNKYTNKTLIVVYSGGFSDFRDKPKLLYEKEFDVYKFENWVNQDRMVSFINNDVLVSCVCDKLELFQVNKDEILRSQKLNGCAACLRVRGREIFVGFLESNEITVYDAVKLAKLKSITLQGIKSDEFPVNITTEERFGFKSRPLFVTWTNETTEVDKSAIFEEENGKIVFQFEDPAGTHCYSWDTDVSEFLGVAAVVYSSTFAETVVGFNKIVFFLLNEKVSSFLIVEVESGISKIRISDRGDNMVTGNYETGEVKVYDMAEIFTYSLFKGKLASTLQKDECAKLANFFKIPRDQTDAILSSEKPSENLLLSLEEKLILQPHNVERLIKAFDELRTNPFCRHIAEIFRKTRSPSYYKEVIEKLEEEMKTFRMTSEEEGKVLKAPWTLHKSPDGRFYYHNSVTKELRWENPERGQRAQSQNESEELYLNLSLKASEFLQESSFEGEFGKFSVRVSEKLTKANCVKLATYFNFPSAKVDLIKNDFETPGITLFDILKERHIVNIHNVMSLKKALEELELKDISDTLVTPYQRKIDRLRFEQQYLSK